LGEKGASDGLEADDKGRVYAGDFEHNSIRQRQTDGEWKTIVHGRVFLLYGQSAAASGWFHEGVDLREKPYTLFPVKIDTGPVLLK
jgi:hypothetical protein